MSSLSTLVMMGVATFFWGFNFPLVHAVVALVPPMEAAFLRFALSALVLIGAVVVLGHSPVRLRNAGILAALAFVGVIGFNLLFFIAMQKTSAVNGALVMGTNPLLTALLAAVVLGERPNIRHVIALPFAFFGVALVVLGNGASLSPSAGDALMIGADLAWAAYNVMVRRWMPAGSPVANLAAIMVFSALGLGGAAVAADTAIVVPDFVPSLEIAVVAMGGTVLAYLLYNHGIAKLGAGKAALFMNMVPVWAMATSALMGVPPSAIQLGGGAVVIASVVYAMRPVPLPS